MLYVSDESGRTEVYVRPYPGPGPAIQISAASGLGPAWARDGREVFFRGFGTDKYYSVKFQESRGTLVPARPVELFEGRINGLTFIRQGDVTPDGRLLLIPIPDEDVITASLDALMPSRISVVQNWFAELEQKVPR